MQPPTAHQPTPISQPRYHWALAMALLLVEGSSSSSAAAEAAPAGIIMAGRVPKDKGHLRCGLYDRQGWLKRPLQSAAVLPAGFRGVCRFLLVSPGAYAIGAFLDENDNGRLDRNFLGYPSEPYGVSNGARIRFFSPPSFDAAQINYHGGELRLELELE